MTVMRVERVVYGVPDLQERVRFFTDLGLAPLEPSPASGNAAVARFMTQAGQVAELRAVDDPALPPPVQDGPSLREIVWGVGTPRRHWTPSSLAA